MARLIINTGKFGVLAEFPADADGKPQLAHFIGHENTS
jgi:hypothetical protein